MTTKKSEKGVILYLALIILTISMAIVLGLSSILIGQIKTIQQMENSMKAFFAADTGIEIALYDKSEPESSYSGSLNGATYEVTVVCNELYLDCPFGIWDSDCNGHFFCYESIGSYREIKRAIEIIR